MNTTHVIPLLFETSEGFEAWLSDHYANTTEVWLKTYKKASGKLSIQHDKALDVALCYGWIDGLAKSIDEESFMQRYTPRGPKSSWSKVNREHIERLTKEGRMKPSGSAAVEAAKADGRWEAAYDSPKNAVFPPEFLALLESNAAAKSFLATLSKVNSYAMIYRLQNAKKQETKERLMERFIQMLEKGETFH